MAFKENLAQMPEITHLSGLNVCDPTGAVIHNIPAIEGKLGSLKLYNALAEQFNGTLNAQAAQQGLDWFAEHVADAQANAGKHPNIDLLFKVQQENLVYSLKPLAK
ncbi:DUF2322 family protein [Kingella negevensis]|uniref:DUF2322 family protein n=2 Tax=Kingella negevensis TaxID=1522312 RepID=UPI00254D73B3|nr:DUF2322 family protein [Kingella negevensis]MDK4680540.1 DUF2322 family protein [Kingella negevensis]MDK4681737.1 DUF2322 family protein [Kingella negevensis]MDK4689935.1 DUF2322 family protein [Kingella negevensis]MDK4692721.1 DUF2322 family protein [Kingella negevensis]MDK4699020.1 DUF2322 family protein [Kingella negevensis]